MDARCAQVPLSTQGAPREAQDETGKETVVEVRVYTRACGGARACVARGLHPVGFCSASLAAAFACLGTPRRARLSRTALPSLACTACGRWLCFRFRARNLPAFTHADARRPCFPPALCSPQCCLPSQRVQETGAPAPARTPERLAAPEEQGVAQKKPKNAKAAPKAGAAAKKAKAPAAKAKKAPVKKAAAKTTVKKTASFKQSKPAASPAVAPGTKASTTQRLAAYTLPPLTFKTGASERNARAKAHRRGRV